MKTIIDPQKLIDETTSYGFKLTVEGGKIKGNPQSEGAAIPPALVSQITAHKDAVIKLLTATPRKPTKPSSKREFITAFSRLEFGECSALQIYSHELGEEFWIVRDEVVLETNRVNFSISEIRELLGVSKEQLKKVYLLKKAFPGSEVVPGIN